MMPCRVQFIFGLAAIDWKAVGVVALCVLAAALALALWAGCGWGAWLFLRKKQQVIFPLHITSRSNLAAQYQIRAELGGLEKAVKSFWEQDGQRLPLTARKHYSYVQEELPQQRALPATDHAAGASLTGAAAKEKKKASQGLKKVSVVTNLVASISGVLAGILPGAAKTPFREVNTTIRAQQQKVAAGKADVNHLQATKRSLDHDTKRLGEAAGVKPAGGQRDNGSGQGDNGGGQAEAHTTGQRLVVTETPVTETARVAPGVSSVCQLIIRPKNPLRSLAGIFQVTVQPVELKEFPLYGPLPVRTLAAEVKIEANNLQRVLFASLVLAVGALSAWGASALIGWLWLLRA